MKNEKIVIRCILIFIIVPLIIHICYSIPSFNSFTESKWSAGELLNYFGCVFGALIAMLGVQLTIKDSKEARRKDLIDSVKPYIAINTLKVSNNSSINILYDFVNEQNSLKNKEIIKRDSNNVLLKLDEKKFDEVNFILSKDQIKATVGLDESQIELIARNGYFSKKSKNGSTYLLKQNFFYFPFIVKNVGKAAAINFQIGLNKYYEESTKINQTCPVLLTSDNQIKVSFFNEGKIDEVEGDYVLSFSYQDIYQNPYIQFFVLHMDKDDFELITTSFSDLKEYKNIKNKYLNET